LFSEVLRYQLFGGKKDPPRKIILIPP